MSHPALPSALRELRDVVRAATPTHRRLRGHLVAISLATIGIDLFCAVIAFFLERHSTQTEIKTFGRVASLCCCKFAGGWVPGDQFMRRRPPRGSCARTRGIWRG